MPLNDVRQVENIIMQDSAPSHHAKAAQHFLWDNTPDFISSQEWITHSSDLNLLDYSVWEFGVTYKNLLMKEGVNHLRTWKIFRMLSRDEWHVVDDQTVRKAILQWKRRLAAVAKANWGPIQHIFCWSVDWLITVTFWCRLRGVYMSDNINVEPLANIVLWRVKLFCLYQG